MSTQSLGWARNTLLGTSDSWCGYCFNSLEGDSRLCDYFSSGQRLRLSVALYVFWAGTFVEANLFSNHPRIVWFKLKSVPLDSLNIKQISNSIYFYKPIYSKNNVSYHCYWFINNKNCFSLYQSHSELDLSGGTHYFKSSMTVLQLQYVFSLNSCCPKRKHEFYKSVAKHLTAGIHLTTQLKQTPVQQLNSFFYAL